MITRTMARESPSLFSPPGNRTSTATNGGDQAQAGVSSSASASSPYSLSNDDMNQLTEEFDSDEQNNLTTSGRTYEELVSASQEQEAQQQQQQHSGSPKKPSAIVVEHQRNSRMSEDTEDSDDQPLKNLGGRQSVGFMLGRNSLSNWSAIGGGGPTMDGIEEHDIPRHVHLEQMNTGRKSNVSRHSLGRNSLLSMDTPNITSVSHVNVSQRRSNQVVGRNSRLSRLAASSHRSSKGAESRRRDTSLNVSHISSSSSSGMEVSGESMLGDSWSPIRTSLENSFAKSVANELNGSNIGVKTSGSLSPIRGRGTNSFSPKKFSPKNAAGLSPNKASSPTRCRKSAGLSSKNISPAKGRTNSPMRNPTKSKSPVRSPIRSPLGDISPNRSPNRGMSPKRTTLPKRNGTTSVASPNRKALSPNGTYSLKEAEGSSLSMPEFTIAEDDKSSNDSSMSLSSGSQTAASSATLLSESAQKRKEHMPSLQEAEAPKNFENVPVAPTLKAASHDEENAMMMQSPEKIATKNHARSPAPTPNSQRRMVKRFRASIPTMNYLMPDDLMEESVERNPNRKEVAEAEPLKDVRHNSPEESERACGVSNQVTEPPVVDETSMAAEETTESEQDTYENAFEFLAELITVPRTKTMRMFHDQSVLNESISHQYRLNRAGTNLLSLQEVILPSIAYEISAVLKHQQKKAQRNVKDGLPESQGRDVVKAIETCRSVVSKCTIRAAKAAGEACRTREKERERIQLERLQQEAEQQKLDRRKAKKERKEARAVSRKERYGRQKREKQRNHPRNKELWQEVAKLMMDIQKLEKEERLWKEALVEVNLLEEHHQPPEKMELDPIAEKEEDVQLLKSVEGADLESTATTLVEDVTMATERINWMLKSVSIAMDESDKLRKEAYDKYQFEGHKFYGYPQVDDSKGLFMALSMDTPLKE